MTDRTHLLDLLRQMILIRRFEEKCAELYTQEKIRGFLHLYIGEEAVGVGAMQAIRADDSIVSTYREHGHALARGLSPGSIMAEMFGKQEGCSRGRGGSMHLFDKASRFFGGNAVVGGGIPLALGLALADRMRSESRITCCFFGDGAVAEGEFHECMNLASLWKLPVLFLCENNRYAMGTRLDFSHAVTDLSKKAAGYCVPASSVDGMDVLAVEEAAQSAAEWVRSGKGPYFLECRTYRFRAHSMYDPELYREKAEVEEWKKRDPIPALIRHMEETGAPAEVDRIEREVAKTIDDAI
ncbi:MAG TPA: pyruvate dehydrogenase (acetyl-transferring) E1 component subunit alpha, partial [Bryobacteraceae bacterium]|nr:pyruvate dehydrogenase (acetyl-transferring) E1 component subunit alpha [Bryobacteraceae bacterium]